MKKIQLIIFTFLYFNFSYCQISLEPKSVLNNRVEIKIPSNFEIMSSEMMELKYPSQRRPTIVYTNETGGINVAFNLTKSKAEQENITSFKDMMIKTFKNAYPSAEWIKNGVEKINGRNIGYLELITPAIDTKIYNLMFFTDLDGQLLLCTFNCTEKSTKEWKPIANEIFQSLKIK